MTSAYLGPAGNLVEFKCPSDEQIGLGDRVKLRTTVDGTQQARYVRKSPRAWQVGIGTATPEQVAQLQGLLAGLYGPPPWVYVGPWAQVTNLLSPAASMFMPGSWFSASGATQSGTVDLDNGARPPYSLVDASAGSIYSAHFPVVPGVPVTASAWAKGNSSYSIVIAFVDAAGGYTNSPAQTIAAPAGGPLVRGSVTALAPKGAVTGRVLLNGAIRAASPAATWTPDMAAWSVGGGAPKVVARGLSEAVQLAVRDEPGLRRSSLSFTLEEVGNA